ncbi:metal-sulfur cluster assembly factor [Haloglomus litoreum]|uniref:metal-sulfur cluster assembly factor n=1 Tax=Haloglomus litoreum TaxID=3034026 RepID=UPI0023E8AD5F|nr:iron-sulfur cluster assembly protein [Haloglomus sp. DT116]
MSVEGRSTQDRVVQRLDNVLDPCSCNTASPVSIVELGLVEEVSVDDESVSVRLLPTSPMCLYMGQIMKDAEREILEIECVQDVELEMINSTEKMWRPERLSDELKEARDDGQLIKNSPAESSGS